MLSGNKISDLSPLMDLPSLVYLDLSNNGLTDVTSLMGMTQLKHLDLSGNGLTKITALTALTKLTYLDLSGSELTSFTPLKSLTALEELHLKSTGLDDGDLASLEALGSLKALNIEDNDELTGGAVDALKLKLDGCTVTHSDLAYKVTLGKAEFDDTAATVDAAPQSVSDLTEAASAQKSDDAAFGATTPSPTSTPSRRSTTLSVLEFDYNSVTDLSALLNLTKLRSLSLMYNKVSGGVAGLTYCTALEELHLDYNDKLSDISALSGLPKLRELTLNGTAVSDLSALSGMKTLETLYLDGCPVDSIEALMTLTGLKELYLRGTELDDADIVLLQIALPGCVIYS